MVGLRAFFAHVSVRARPTSVDRIESLCRPTALPVPASHRVQRGGLDPSRGAPVALAGARQQSAAVVALVHPAVARVAVRPAGHARAPAVPGAVARQQVAVARRQVAVARRQVAVARRQVAVARLGAALLGARRLGVGRRTPSKIARASDRHARTAPSGHRAPTEAAGPRAPGDPATVRVAGRGLLATVVPNPPAARPDAAARVVIRAPTPVSSVPGATSRPQVRAVPSAMASVRTAVTIARRGEATAPTAQEPGVRPDARVRARTTAPTVAKAGVPTTAALVALRGWRRGGWRSR